MANNIFQQQITPVTPKALANERIYVYVPTATAQQAGIASFNSNDFTINLNNNNKVAIKWTYAKDGVEGLVKIKEDGYLAFYNGELDVNKTKLLEGYATQSWVLGKDYATNTALQNGINEAKSYTDTRESVIKNWVLGKNYASETYVNNQIDAALAHIDLDGYAKESWVISQGYATETWVTEQLSHIDLSDYVTQTDLSTTLASYATLSDVKINNTLIKDMIMPGATAYNPLDPNSNPIATKDFVNSTVGTNTAIFRGTYNLVTDLNLGLDATEAQIAAALANEISTVTNNDYCYVEIPQSVSEPTVIQAYDRYKYSDADNEWAFEFELNNSSFTAAQWAAINSGITASIVSNIVTLNDNQTITGIKTFDNQVNFSNSSAAGTNVLSIKNDNGYNAKIKMGSTENMRLMTGGTFFGATVGVTTDNAYNLGASGTAWKDFYLKGKIALDNYIIDKDSFGQLQIRNANTTSLQIDGGTVRSQNIVPMTNNQKDLGSSSMQWRDIYLGGVLNVIKSGVSGDAKWHIEEDQYGQLVVSRTYNDVKSGMIQFNGNSIKPVGANGNLGSASQQWKDLYLSGNLSDGTNSISVAQILAGGAFKSLNLTSTTLSADELTTIQNYNVVLQSDITLGSGTTLHAQTILTKPFSYSNTLRGLYIDNSKVGTYLIDTNTNTLGQGAQDIVLNGIAQINSKAIPSYPNDNKTYYLEYTNGTLTWVQDNTVKVNTTSYSTKRVYGQNAVGAEQMIQVSPNAYGQFLVERDSNGMFNVNEPIQGTHPASKNYVDTAIASAITTALNTPV